MGAVTWRVRLLVAQLGMEQRPPSAAIAVHRRAAIYSSLDASPRSAGQRWSQSQPDTATAPGLSAGAVCLPL